LRRRFVRKQNLPVPKPFSKWLVNKQGKRKMDVVGAKNPWQRGGGARVREGASGGLKLDVGTSFNGGGRGDKV